MRKIYILATMLTSCLSFVTPQLLRAQTRFDDSTALVTLYNNNGGTGWVNSTNWLSTQPIDSWYGVHVSSTGRVDSVSLPGNNLINDFPNTVNALTVLSKFDVSQNNLSNSMPYFNGDSLLILNVAFNQISGSLSVYNLPRIKIMRVNNNSLVTGSGSVADYSTMVEFNASHNMFTDNLPFFGGPGVLDSVDLSYNQLMGTVDYYGYPTCNYYNISHNQLSGYWVYYTGLASPATFDVSHNKFTFNELEPVFSSLPVHSTYAPQDTILPLNFKDSLHVTAGGHLSNNTYTWYYNNTQVAQNTGDSDYVPTPAGNYNATVTNAVVTGLTLLSDTIYIVPPFTATWTGGTSADWNTAANWNDNAVPTSNNNVVIPAGTTYRPIISNTTSGDTVRSITIALGTTLTIINSDTLTVLDSIESSDTIFASAGSLNIAGTVKQLVTGVSYVNNLIINNASGVTMTAGNTIVSGVYTPLLGQLSVTDIGHLTLASGPSGTASIAQGSGNYLFGYATVERYIPAHRAWRFLTTPLNNSGAIFNNWQNRGTATDSTGVDLWAPTGNPSSNGMLQGGGAPNIEYFNAVGNNWIAITDTYTTLIDSTPTVAGNKAFGVFVTGPYGSGNIVPSSGAAATTLAAYGILQTGEQVFTYNNVPAGNFMLIGNPYASPVDFTGVGARSAASGNINNIMWAWDAQRSGTSYGGYVTFSWDAKTSSYDQDIAADQTAQTTIIQSGQAIMVQADTTTHTNGTPENVGVTFEESDKAAASTATNGVFGIQSLAQQVRIALNRVAGSVTTPVDGILVKYGAGYNAGASDDADKRYDFDENLALRIGTHYLAIERRPLPVLTDTLFLDIYALKQNTGYSFTITPQNIILGEGIQPYLVDTYLKTATQISFATANTISFSTTGDAGSFGETRFVIVFSNPNALATTIINLRAAEATKGIQVQWTSVTETGIKNYVVEKSADAINFAAGTNVKPINNGNSQNYSWLDENPFSGDNYYRIQIVNNDGSIKYSDVVLVKTGILSASFKAYPNPLPHSQQLRVDVGGVPAGKYTLQLFSADGKQVMQKPIITDGGSSTQLINLPTIATGVYQVMLVGQNGKTWKQALEVN